jgi:competence protein ComEA
MKGSNQLGFGLIALLLGIILGVGGVTLTNRQRPAPIQIIPPSPALTPLPTPTASFMQVYINGAVAAPDVYQLPPGAILRDGIAAAGGFTPDASADFINLALPVQPGMQVYVPRKGEETAVPQQLIIPSFLPDPANSAVRSGGTIDLGLVNINSASQTELETLPGIGPSTARSIINHREDYGLFATIEDIMNVAGIGPAKFAAIQDLITVDE